MVIIDNVVLLSEFKRLVSNVYIQIFVWVVLGDIITGIFKGLYVKDGNSTKGLLGIVKHMFVVISVLVAYPYLKILGMESIATGFVISYVVVYLISITENFGQMGLWVPGWIKKRLSKLKDEAEEKPLTDKELLQEIVDELKRKDDQ